MGRKNRFKAKKPPLSTVDKFIYVFLMIFSLILMLSVFIIELTALKHLCFSNSNVVAATSHIGFSSLPFVFIFSMAFGFIVAIGFEKRQPIFGNRNFVSKFSEHTVKVYPLFSREFRENLSWRSKKKIRIFVRVVSVLLVLSFIILLFGIYSRKTLDSSDMVCSYNSFNHVIHSAHIEDADKIVVTVSKSTRRISYGLNIGFDFGNKKYIFGLESFDGMTREEVLKYMLRLKELCPDDKFSLNGTERLENLIAYEYFTLTEKSLVYELFDVYQ